MATQEEGWIRKATPQESWLHSCSKKGFMIISYVLRVAASRNLQEEDVNEALQTLFQ